jgi:hypothetical protein
MAALPVTAALGESEVIGESYEAAFDLRENPEVLLRNHNYSASYGR